MLRFVPMWWRLAIAFDLVAGIVLLAVGQSIPAFILLGLAAIGATSAAFYAVGRSEDADREQHPHG